MTKESRMEDRVGRILNEYLANDVVFTCSDNCGFEIQVITYEDACKMIELAIEEIKQ